MTIRDITQILSAEVICGEEHLEKEVHNACGSDMMSDVLAFVKDQSLLITGLCNPQVIRTAEMMDIICICFVRGKEPDEAMVELVDEVTKNIILRYIKTEVDKYDGADSTDWPAWCR